MDRPETITDNCRGRARGAAVALTAAAVALTALAPAVQAQGRSNAPYIVEVASARQSGGSASANLPDAVRPVLLRAATMLQAAQSRYSAAPYGARQSYQAAVTAFRQMLATGRYAATASTAADTGGTTGLPVSSTQVAEDIRTLKSAMNGATGAQRDALQRVVSLYATGAKEYFTGQLRDALFSTDNTSGGAIVIRGQRRPSNATAATSGYGSASSAVITGRAVTPRGAQTQGGVVQGDGSVVPVASAPSIPATNSIGAPPGSNIVPGGVNVTQTPPVGVAPTVPGTAVSPLGPAPVVVTPAVPAVPPPTPVTPPPASDTP